MMNVLKKVYFIQLILYEELKKFKNKNKNHQKRLHKCIIYQWNCNVRKSVQHESMTQIIDSAIAERYL